MQKIKLLGHTTKKSSILKKDAYRVSNRFFLNFVLKKDIPRYTYVCIKDIRMCIYVYIKDIHRYIYVYIKDIHHISFYISYRD